VDGDDVVMLYTIKPGPSVSSFGVRVAAGAGFPAEVIQDAEAILSMLEHPSSKEPGKAT